MGDESGVIKFFSDNDSTVGADHVVADQCVCPEIPAPRASAGGASNIWVCAGAGSMVSTARYIFPLASKSVAPAAGLLKLKYCEWINLLLLTVSSGIKCKPNVVFRDDKSCIPVLK